MPTEFQKQKDLDEYLLEQLSEAVEGKPLPGRHNKVEGRKSWKEFLGLAEKTYELSREAMSKAAEIGGYVVTYSTPNNLILDFDRPSPDKDPHAPGGWEKEKFQALLDRIVDLQRFGLGITQAIARPSFREGCWHAMVYVPDPDGPFLQRMADPWCRSALQLFLGSDPTKEILSWHRCDMEEVYPSMLIDDAYGVENYRQVYPPEVEFTPDPDLVDQDLQKYQVKR
jgi:hypothetical protein